jgi:hypothetical protein
VRDREKLRAWYSRADLFLFPSTFDTNGLVVREAAASRTASVIIKDSCASEGVTDGRNGFLIDENSASLAARLRELIVSPEAMKRVGEGAGDELYISWEDAVSHAYDRYEVVIDNYKSGVYGRKDPIRGSMMQSHGELMQILGDIDSARKDLAESAADLADEIDRSLRSARNKALTNVITARYETKETIRQKGREALDAIGSLLDDVNESFWDKRK